MEYLNEHTWAGQVGHILVIVAFVTSIAALYGYWRAAGSQLRDHAWHQTARTYFMVHSLAVLGVVSLLFFMIANRYFEYHYVWKYSNLSMEGKYIFSCFWSGQEGSLLLWSFWIMVLAWIFVTASGKSASSAMPFVLLVQAFIFSLLLGVYAGDVKIGNSPFILIRELPENAGMPWARMNDYLLKITSFQDGVGLNPLLQNYWMVIHPPVLFLGFAATVFPFAIALGGASRSQLSNGWTKRAMPWSIFAVLSLGCGILLGGAWAYESLSFGGFWAWDPVENASLVPWIIMVGGLHALQITRKRNRGLYLSLLFTVAPFLLVLYSSFLTRSGILGESSVHSFTENGLFIQLLMFLFSMSSVAIWFILGHRKLRLIFLLGSALILSVFLFTGNLMYTLPVWLIGIAGLLIVNYEKHFESNGDTMQKSSREFWMLAGVLLMLISSIQITISTSVPVLNRIFGTQLDAFTEITSRNLFYHNWQIPVAIIITFLVGITQFMKYRRTEWKDVVQQLRVPTIIALAFTLLLTIIFKYDPIHEWNFFLLLTAIMFAIVLNASFAIRVWKQSTEHGTTIAHIGFAVLLLGALISGSRKEIISENRSAFTLEELNKDFRNGENILLRQGDTVRMNAYFVSYRERFKEGNKLHYAIDYFTPEGNGSEEKPGNHAFTLYPMVQLNEQFGNVAEPGTGRFLTHDIFTHIKYADMEPSHLQDGYTSDGFMGETMYRIKRNASFSLENLTFEFTDIFLVTDPNEKSKLGLQDGDIVVKAVIKADNIETPAGPEIIEPLFVVRDSTTVIFQDVYSAELDTRVRIAELSQEENTLVLGIRQREFVVMQALIFPGMNVLWAGCVMMILGCAISLRKYFATSQKRKATLSPAYTPTTLESGTDTRT